MRLRRGRAGLGYIVAVAMAGSAGLPGCASVLPALGAIAQGAQVLGTALDLARDGSKAFFLRNPNREAEQRVGRALMDAQKAVLLLDSAVAAGQGVERARLRALEAYETLRKLLYEFGVPGGVAPGGAENVDAPMPEPFFLPTRGDLEASME